MRIAVISTPFVRVPPNGYGGTELFCYELVEGLHDRGHDVTLFATHDSTVSCRKRALYHRPVWPPSAADELNHVAWALLEVARSSYDVVHLNSPLGIPLTSFVRIPAVYTLHSHREEPTSRIFAIHPDLHYVAISRRQLELEVALPQATVIHHGLSLSRYSPSFRDEGYLLHLGRYCADKGTHIAIDAAILAGLPIKLAGRTHPADVDYFEEHVAPRLALPNVSELGEAGPERKIRLLQGARSLVIPLQWEEPFGLVAIEAMLVGTPVIGFPRGSFPEIIDEGVTGFLAPDGDVESIARIARQLGSFDRRACAERARARFNAGRMVSSYEALYGQAITAWCVPKTRAA